MEPVKQLDRKKSLQYLKGLFRSKKITTNLQQPQVNLSTKATKKDYLASTISDNHQQQLYDDQDTIQDRIYHSDIHYQLASSNFTHHHKNDNKNITSIPSTTPVIYPKTFKKLKKVGRGGTANIYLLSSSNQPYSDSPTFFSSLFYFTFWKKKYSSPPFSKKSSLLTTTTTATQHHKIHSHHHCPYEKNKKNENSCNKTKGERAFLAIKRYHAYIQDPYESKEEYHQKLLNEFYLTKKLKDHQHIVQVYDIFKDKKDRWCMLMDYYFGGDLLTILHYKNLSTLSMDCLFKQLIRGVSYLHSNGIAHRDIKPDNLLMTTTGVLKIIDFGLARYGFDEEDDLHQDQDQEDGKKLKRKKKITCQSLCGTPEYLAPELFNKKENNDNADDDFLLTYDALAMDIWSTAITWYCLLYKQIPFVKAHLKDPYYSQFYYQYRTYQHWSALEKCDPIIQHCILNMLNPDPELRWTIDQCLHSDYVESIQVCYDHSYIEHRHHFTSASIHHNTHLLPPRC